MGRISATAWQWAMSWSSVADFRAASERRPAW
jgi:hypothetical protein